MESGFALECISELEEADVFKSLLLNQAERTSDYTVMSKFDKFFMQRNS